MNPFRPTPLSTRNSLSATHVKAERSIGTDASSEDLLFKKMTMGSSSSLVSLEDDPNHTPQKDIFTRYLFTLATITDAHPCS